MSLIEFREPSESDMVWLAKISTHFSRRFLADGEAIGPETFTLEDMAYKYTTVFTADDGSGAFPVGSAGFTDINKDLSAVLHFIMLPKYLKDFLDNKIYLEALVDRFHAVKVKKFLIITPEFNKLSQRIAQRIGFKHVGTLASEVYYDNQPKDVLFYELTRKDLSRALSLHFIEQESEPPPVAAPKKTRKRQPRKGKTHVEQQEQSIIGATAQEPV